MRLLLVSGPGNASTIAAGLNLMKRGYAVYFSQPCRITLSPYAPILGVMAEETQWRGRWSMSDIEMIKRCDGIYLCHGWTEEPICKVHMECAKNANRQLFFEGVTEPRD